MRWEDPRLRVVPVAGVSFRPGAVEDPSFDPGRRLALVPEPENEHDPGAVAIWNEERTLQAGYVPRDVAPELDGDEQALSLWRVEGGLRVLIVPAGRLARNASVDSAAMPPPYRIETERLVVRCWEPRDAPLLKDAVDSSLEHMRPWMPWAHEDPQPVEAKVELLRGFRGRFDLGQDFVYGIFSPDESEAIGGTGLHTRRGEGIFEIGYWIRASRVRQGFATEATAALTRVGFELCDVERIELRVDPANEASLGIPRKLGFVEEGTMRGVFHGADGQPRASDAVIFALLRGEFEHDVELKAFDAAGERVL